MKGPDLRPNGAVEGVGCEELSLVDGGRRVAHQTKRVAQRLPGVARVSVRELIQSAVRGLNVGGTLMQYVPT